MAVRRHLLLMNRMCRTPHHVRHLTGRMRLSPTLDMTPPPLTPVPPPCLQLGLAEVVVDTTYHRSPFRVPGDTDNVRLADHLPGQQNEVE